MDDGVSMVVMDPRLTPEACRVALYVAAHGDGEHEIPHDDFTIVLNHASKAKVAAAIKLASHCGYLERRPGGRGHSDRYEFRSRKNPDLKIKVPESTGAKTDRSRNPRGLSAPVVEEEEDVDVPPYSPPTDLSDGGSRALDKHADKLEGCRDSLRDYLRQRVKPARQGPYVHTIAGWLNGLTPGVWRKRSGGTIPTDKRTAMLAAALNDLAASDESTMKRPQGDPANLQTKLSVLIGKEYRNDRTNRGGAASEAGGEASDNPLGDASRRSNFGFDEDAA